MLAQEASKLDIDISFLDKSLDFPAAKISRSFEIGDFTDFDDVLKFGRTKDIVTIEIENVNTDALKQLEEEGVKVFPNADTIAMIKDKGAQKQFYTQENLPTSPYILVANKSEIISKIDSGDIRYPFVQKSRVAGYDGKGVTVINNAGQLDKCFDVPSVIEQKVSIDKELAIVVSRNEDGLIAFFDPVEMVFDQRGNLLDYLLAPAEIEASMVQEMKSLAHNLVSSLNYIGLLAIEFFLDKEGRLLINEIAPRTHNSGHHTIDACYYSQFNAQLRALLNQAPLDYGLHHEVSIMYNLLGDVDTEVGEVKYEGIEDVLSIQDVYIHIYGKDTVKPLRKMGHLNIVADTKAIAIEKLDQVKRNLKIKA